MATTYEVSFALCLGTGAFSEVYLARVSHDGRPDRLVADKVLKPDLVDQAEAEQRLRDEARLLTVLRHPGIPKAIDLVHVDGRLALLSSYVDGIVLHRSCTPGRLLPVRAALGVMSQLTQLLQAARVTTNRSGEHLQVVHRDIKPENVLIGQEGRAYLIDWGSARTDALVRAAHTAIGDSPMTPGFAPPELILNSTFGVEGDVYSLGCTLYQALTGQRLFTQKHFRDQIPILESQAQHETFLSRQLSQVKQPDIRALLQRMLVWSPKNRATLGESQRVVDELIGTLGGPTLERWVETHRFPPPMGVAEATLKGRTLMLKALATDPSAWNASSSPNAESIALAETIVRDTVPIRHHQYTANTPKTPTPPPTPLPAPLRGTPNPTTRSLPPSIPRLRPPSTPVQARKSLHAQASSQQSSGPSQTPRVDPLIAGMAATQVVLVMIIVGLVCGFGGLVLGRIITL